MIEPTVKLLIEWQHRLGLDDWYIVVYPNQDGMETAGSVEYTEATKTASISLISEGAYGACIRPLDTEKTLVHELLHLKLSLLADGVSDLQERYVHQIIDDLARALVDAKRNGKEYTP